MIDSSTSVFFHQILYNSSTVADLNEAAGITWLDEGFGALRRLLNSTIIGGVPLIDRTFIAFTMDHGMGAKDALYEAVR